MADAVPAANTKRLSILSGLDPQDQRAGRTDGQIIERLERATGKKGLADLGMAAGMGPQAKFDVLAVEAHFLEKGKVDPLHDGSPRGKAMLDALERGLANRDPLAEATAAQIGKQIWAESHKGGAIEYHGKPVELSNLGDALDLRPKEQQRLAEIVRRTLPKDQPLTMDYAGRLGTARQLAAQEVKAMYDAVLSANSSTGSIMAAMAGMAGGTAADMRAAAKMGDLIMSSSARPGSASDAALRSIRPSPGGVVGTIGTDPTRKVSPQPRADSRNAETVTPQTRYVQISKPELLAQYEKRANELLPKLIHETLADEKANPGRAPVAEERRARLDELGKRFDQLRSEVGAASALTPEQRKEANGILREARDLARKDYNDLRDKVMLKLRSDDQLKKIEADLAKSGDAKAPPGGALQVKVVGPDKTEKYESLNLDHRTRLSDDPWSARGKNNLVLTDARQNQQFLESIRKEGGVWPANPREDFIVRHQLNDQGRNFAPGTRSDTRSTTARTGAEPAPPVAVAVPTRAPAITPTTAAAAMHPASASSPDYSPGQSDSQKSAVSSKSSVGGPPIGRLPGQRDTDKSSDKPKDATIGPPRDRLPREGKDTTTTPGNNHEAAKQHEETKAVKSTP